MTALPAAAGLEARRGVKTARLVHLVHSWLGLKLFLVLTLVTLTGTLAVLRDEIDWLVFPQIRVTPGPERIGFDRTLALVRAAYPEAGILGQVPRSGAGPRSAVQLVTVSAADGVRRVWVDPYRGVVQGSTPLLTPGYFLSQLHAYLLIPTWGYVIVCTFAFFLLASLISGILTYPKFWRGFFRRPRGRNLRTLMGDLHRLGGVWSLWFLVVMMLTGFWYFWIFVGEPMLGFPKAITHHDHPKLDAAALDRLGPTAPTPLTLDALADQVRKAQPKFDIRFASLPATHESPVTFQGNTGELFAPNLSEVHVDRFSGTIVGRELVRDEWSFGYLDALADAFHFGDFAGLISKLVWFTFGLVMTGMSITGLVIFWKRTRRGEEERSRVRSVLAGLKPWGGGMGWFKPVNLIVLCVSVYATTMAIKFYSGGTLPARFAPQAVGPWTLGAAAVGSLGDMSNPIRSGARVMVLVSYCPGCWNDIKRLWVGLGDAPPTPERQIRVEGQPGYALARMALPQEIGAGLRLWLIAEAWNGEKHQASWPLSP